MTVRALARGSLLYTVANVTPRFGAFLLLPLLTRFLGQSGFGLLSLAGSAALLLSITLRFGLDSALLRLHFDLDGRGRADLYATVAVVTGGIAAIVLGVSALVVPALVRPATAAVWLLAVGVGTLSTFQYLPSVWLRATQQPGRYLALSVAGFALGVTTTVLLVTVADLGVVGALLGNLAAAAVLAGAGLVLVVKLRPWRPRRDLAGRAISFGLPLLPHALGGWLLNVSDRWMLGLFLVALSGETLAAIGVYSLGYQLGYAIGLIAISFNAAWLPTFYRLGQGAHGPGLLRPMITVAVGGAAMLATAVAVLAPELVLLMAGREWLPAADVAAVVAFASVANTAALMLSGVLTLLHSTRMLPVLTLAAAVVNILANALLIPPLGIMGAAWSTMIAYAVLLGLSWLVVRRRYPLSADWRRISGMVALGIAITVAARLIGPASGGLALAAWHVLLAGGGIVAIALLLGPSIGELRTALGSIPPDPARSVRRLE